MSTVGSKISSEPVTEFDRLARTARRALAADAVLIALDRGAEGPLGRMPVPVADADGFDEIRLDALRGDISLLDGHVSFGGDEPQLIDFMAARDAVTARLATGHGFAAGLAAAVTMQGVRIGAVYALRCEPAPFPNAMLITTYAHQVSISLAQGELTVRPEAGAATTALLDSLQPAAQSPEALSRLIGEQIAPLFGAGRAGVMSWEPQAGMLRLLPGGLCASRELCRLTQVHVDDPRSNAARVFATGRPYICNEALDDPAVLAEQTRALGIERVMTVPLQVGGRRVGIIHFTNGPRDFEVADLALADAVLPRVAAAVELALELRDRRRERQIESILSAAAIGFGADERGGGLPASTLESLGEALEADALALTSAGGEALSWGVAPDEILVDAASDPEMRSDATEADRAVATGQARCSVPVCRGGHRHGTLVAWRGWARPFEAEERRALVRFASIAAFGFAAEAARLEQVEGARLRERRRIADGLHDDVAQILFAAQLNLDAILERADEQTAAGVARALGLLVRGDQAIREVISGISEPAPEPLDERFAAVTAAVEQVFSRPVELDLHRTALVAAFEFGEAVREALLRVAREGLVNVAKHAGDCSARVELDFDAEGRLRLTVRDDGVGYAGGAPGHGLGALRRAVEDCGGELRIAAASEGGTELTATIAAPDPELSDVGLGALR